MALMQLTILPLGTGDCSVGKYVESIREKLEEKGAVFSLNDMGTEIEGRAEDLLHLVAEIYEAPFEQGAVRVVTNIMIDDRRDKDVGIGDKIRSLLDQQNI